MDTQTINISLPKKLVKIMDERANVQFSTRSDLIRTAVISYLKRESKWKSVFTYGKKAAKKTKIKEKDIEKIVDEYRQNSR